MDKQAWLVRPKPHGQERLKEFLTNSFVAVGWPGIGDLSGLRESELRTLIVHKYGSDPSALATLKMIVYRMQIGDYILVPNDGIVHFGKITTPYRYEATKDNDVEGYPHQRGVEWCNVAIQRENLPVDLQKSTRVVRVSSELTKHINIIDNIINNKNDHRGAPSVAQMDTMIDPSDYLFQQAIMVLQNDLKSDDPSIRLKAAQVVMETMKKKK